MVELIAAALVALLCLMLVSVEDWWQMGRRILWQLLALAGLALVIGAAQYLWA